MASTIGLLGDVMLGRGVAARLGEVRPEELWAAEVRELCASCDLVVCNLECCISTRGNPTERIPSKPFFFRGPPAAVESLRAIGVQAVGLANNHALDYEEAALLDTLELLDNAGIAVTGAGTDQGRARRGVALRAGDVTVGLVAASDHPAEYAADEGRPGIAYAELDRGVPRWLDQELGRLAGEHDVVIAFPHWGPNMTPEPARWQRQAALRMRAAGASLVAGHSAHVFHGIGWEGGAPLLFDLGDALDDYAVNKHLRNDLGVMALWRPGDAGVELELVGLSLDYCHTELATGGDADWIARRLADACQTLGSSVERAAEQRFYVTPG